MQAEYNLYNTDNVSLKPTFSFRESPTNSLLGSKINMSSVMRSVHRCILQQCYKIKGMRSGRDQPRTSENQARPGITNIKCKLSTISRNISDLVLPELKYTLQITMSQCKTNRNSETCGKLQSQRCQTLQTGNRARQALFN